MPQAQAVDRLSIICAAGQPTKKCDPVADILKEYSRDCLAEKLVNEKERVSKLTVGESASPIIPEGNQLKDALSPDLNKSRFLEFKDRFIEDLYCKQVPLGKPKPAYSKPDHITNESVTFGIPYPKGESVYELAFPKSGFDKLLKVTDDKYRHGDLNLSKTFQKRYDHKFDRNRAYGKSINIDTSGVMVRSILQDSYNYSKLLIVRSAQHDFIQRNRAWLGLPMKKQALNLSPDTVFGCSTNKNGLCVKNILGSTLSCAEATKCASDTTYRAFSADLYNSPHNCRSPAGQFESKYPRKGQCKFVSENLGEETSVKALISPNIPMHFGLSHRDFMMPRSKDQIKRIFTKAGYDLKDEDQFEKVWNAASTEWTSLGDKVSVEAFKFAIQKINNESK